MTDLTVPSRPAQPTGTSATKESGHGTLAAVTPVLVLAGGMGTRLRGQVPNVPKVLAIVRGRPFLTYLLDWLCDSGTREVVLCTGFRAEMVQQAIGARYRSLDVRYSVEREPLGTGGAARLALNLLEASDGQVIVMNGDTLVDLDLGAMLRHHVVSGAQGTVAVTHAQDAGRFGTVAVDQGMWIRRFAEKQSETPSAWVSMGIYVLERRLLGEAPSGTRASIEYDLLPRWVETGLSAYVSSGRFVDIGTPESYAAVNDQPILESMLEASRA